MSRAISPAENDSRTFLIDPMTEHDLLEVVAIEETCGLSLWGWDAYRAELDRPESIMLVARLRASPDGSDARLCGFIAARVQAGELHVNNIGVRQSERRRGVGGALMSRALRIGAHYGAFAAILEVRAGNDAAQALYRAHGFVVKGRRRGYYREPREDALVMSRRLEREA